MKRKVRGCRHGPRWPHSHDGAGIENGAAGIHIEDQKPGTKKYGHTGGKMLVSTREDIQRLIACRLRADIMNSAVALVARTAAEEATLIDSNTDPIARPHIRGAKMPDVEPLYEASRKGTDTDWEERAGCMTYPDAVAKALRARGVDPAQWLKDYLKMSLTYMRKAAAGLSGDADPQTGDPVRDGGAGGRAPPDPRLQFSPSFNWDAYGITGAQMESFILDFAKLGFFEQFFNLAGFHGDAVSIDLRPRLRLAGGRCLRCSVTLPFERS